MLTTLPSAFCLRSQLKASSFWTVGQVPELMLCSRK